MQWGGAVLSGDCLQGCGERMGQGCQRSSYEPEVSLGGSQPGVKRPVCYYQLQMLGGEGRGGVQMGCFHYIWI